jgi:hypothetical protein
MKKRTLKIILYSIAFSIMPLVALITVLTPPEHRFSCVAMLKGKQSFGCYFLKGHDDVAKYFWGGKSKRDNCFSYSSVYGGMALVSFCEKNVSADTEGGDFFCVPDITDKVKAVDCFGMNRESSLVRRVSTIYEDYSSEMCKRLYPQATLLSEKYQGSAFPSCEEQEKLISGETLYYKNSLEQSEAR